MLKKLNAYAAICGLFWVMPSLAEQFEPKALEIVTLQNGAQVQLNDDFTWQYLLLNTQSETTGSIETSNAVVPVAVGASETPLANSASSHSPERLSDIAINQAELLKSTAKNGVKISLLNSQWDDKDRLGLHFQLVNTGTKNYVQILLEVSLYADSGTLLTQQEVKVWQAIFRMPDTYLRKEQSRTSEILWLEGVDKTQWDKQLLSLKITNMESR
ncbi:MULTISPECIES: DUF3157 family protein [unclassified Agarivorans]|uniref:DUF3157 family protein n=1 Tax=unclassified Agarivorans TaxID=2636026 RepID=UPI0026E3F443|nr:MULTISPECIES: DUF3157 family protein [unclassified Agarivorans]MDO6685951.1 DUF3157 family protein [Agarivorans sp. 3_MG-2023]MDO6713911.1 DUF3157 family protein [Agarivorans sp. 2_MG-2023]